MVKKLDKQQRDLATFDLRIAKNRHETVDCPNRKNCVELWGGEEIFCKIHNLTKFELIYQQDQFIYKTGDPVTSLYVIQSGAIKLEKKVEGGGNHVSGFYFTGDLIGSESLYLEQHRYKAVTLKETQVCEIMIEKLASLDEPAVTIQKIFSTLLGRKLYEMDKHLYDTRYLRSDKRLLNFLKEICTKQLTQIDDSLNLYELPIKKTDIANYLGMRPESASRALLKLKGLGIVKDRSSRKKVVIDIQKLLSGK